MFCRVGFATLDHKTWENIMKKTILKTLVMLAFLALLLPSPQSIFAKSELAEKVKCVYGYDVDSSFWEEVVSQLNPQPKNTDLAIKALKLWMPFENTKACWNPLATTKVMPGSTRFGKNTANVQSYPDKSTGAKATALTLNLSYYKSIRLMLAQQKFDEAGINSGLKTWIGNPSYAANLTKKWKALYNQKNTNQPSTPSEQPSTPEQPSAPSEQPSVPLEQNSGGSDVPLISPMISILTPDGMAWFCLQVSEPAGTNGSRLQISTCDGNNPKQQFKFIQNGNKTSIVSKYSNKCLDVPKSHTKENGALIQQWACSGTANQLWTLESKPNGHWIKSDTGMCLDVRDGIFTEGTKVQIWSCIDGNTNQLWSSPSR
jgi:hypothetical protein